MGAAEVAELLLHLEAALNRQTAPAWEAACRQLRLRALRDTMERRTPLQVGPQKNASRLQARLRSLPPAALGLPPDKT